MLPINPSQIPAFYKRARAAQQAGRADEALRLYRSILAANPTLAEAHFQVGRIAAGRGDTDAAVAAFEKALAAKPAEPAIWSALADTLLKAGRPGDAAALPARAQKAGLAAEPLAALGLRTGGRSGARAVTLDTAGRKEAQRLVQLMSAGRFAEAERGAAALARRQPGVAAVTNILGSARAAQGKRDAAEKAFRAALAQDPEFVEARIAYAEMLIGAGRPAEAQRILAPAARDGGGPARVRGLSGRALSDLGDQRAALAELDAALEAAPKDMRLRAYRGQARLRDGRPIAAADDLEAAVGAGLATPALQLDLVRALGRAGREAEALARLDRLIAEDPDRVDWLAERAHLYQQTGQFAAAETDLQAAIARNPLGGALYRMIAFGRKLPADDPVVAQMEETYARDDLPDAERRELAFALAKAAEDARQHDRVFPYLNAANALTRKAWPYDIAADIAAARRITEAFTAELRTACEGQGHTGCQPIFVTGLPRSGTTLVEQIIASHSRVTGGGELARLTPGLAAAVETLHAGASDASPDFAAIGRDYCDWLAARFPGADIVTDKSITTYAYLGFAKLALPGARIVVVRRDPRDTCLSIYKNMFPGGTHRYADDLTDLGTYYRMHEALIGFWRDVWPEAFLEISYEALTADPEPEARRLIAHCGLDWEDGCLNFHEGKRRVETLSGAQVRQPIYRSSVSAWEKYAGDLAPLFAALEDDTPIL